MTVLSLLGPLAQQLLASGREDRSEGTCYGCGEGEDGGKGSGRPRKSRRVAGAVQPGEFSSAGSNHEREDNRRADRAGLAVSPALYGPAHG